MRPLLLGAVIGALPGLVLVLIAIVISGELELTLGALGVMLIPAGAALGAIAVLRLRKN